MDVIQKKKQRRKCNLKYVIMACVMLHDFWTHTYGTKYSRVNQVKFVEDSL